MECKGSYKEGVRIHPETKAAECPVCGLRFDYKDMAGETKRNVPLHSPAFSVLLELEFRN